MCVACKFIVYFAAKLRHFHSGDADAAPAPAPAAAPLRFGLFYYSALLCSALVWFSLSFLHFSLFVSFCFGLVLVLLAAKASF